MLTIDPEIELTEVVDYLTPHMDQCPMGGNHTPIPIQGGGGSVCSKCNSSC